MNLIGPINSGAASGGAGVATANNSSTALVKGLIRAVYVKYNDSPPATTDVVIKTVGTSPAPPTNTLLTLTNAAASGWFYPRQQVHDSAGAGVSYNGTHEIYEPVAVYDYINVAIAQANNDDSVDVWVLVS